MVCEFRCDGEDLFAIFLKGDLAEAFDGKEFLFGVRDVGGNGGQGGKLHDHVGRNIILLDIRKIRAQRQLKKGMYGAAASIDCRNSGRSENDKTFHGRLGDILQKSSLARAGLASKKDRAPCEIHIALG